MRPKLVRDKIPEIVGMYGHVSGKQVRFYQIEPEDLQVELERKLLEEVAEFLLSPCSEELADILEAAEALKRFYPDTAQVKNLKALQKGGFEEGWMMAPVPESESEIPSLRPPS
jgi:predicted house-cleaning noncanonical NTP pyrophosphatase (MazG superfamily)